MDRLKVFVSYSHADNLDGDIKELVDIIHGRFNAVFKHKVELFFDKENKYGDDLSIEIRQFIEQCHVFISMVSPSYCRTNRGAWSEFEYFKSIMGQYVDNQMFVPMIFESIEPMDEARTGIFRDPKVPVSYDISDFCETKADRARHSDFVAKMVRNIKDQMTVRAGVVRGAMGEDLSVKEEIEKTITSIRERYARSTSYTVFRNSLILNILKDVSEEINSINEGDYKHNISLDKGFVTRATAIFSPAEEVFAVSVDTASSFWLNEGTKEIAVRYTEAQPLKTFRLFVFSTPRAMLQHRWVLDKHARQYGMERGGRVLMTSIKKWQAYLDYCKYVMERTEEKNTVATVSSSKIPSLSEDFGFLSFPLANASKNIEARLDRSSLSFRQAPSSPFQNMLRTAFTEEPDVNHYEDGTTFTISPYEDSREKAFWLWNGCYATHDTNWFRCVSDVFDEDIDFGPTNNSIVMHNVFFAPDTNKISLDDFESFMKSIIDRLLDLRSPQGETMIRSIWFRRKNETDLSVFRDPNHGGLISIADDLKWQYCLSMSFGSLEDLAQYYGDPIHAEIRKDVYCTLDPQVGALYNNGATAGDIIEMFMTRYMYRMDFVVPNPYIVYSAIESPRFE